MTCMLSYGTPAALAAFFATLRYFSALASQSLWYCSGVSVTITGSTEKVWNVSETVIDVTFAPIDFANASPCLTAFSESSEPSLGIKICLYMTFSFWLLLPVGSLMSQVIDGFSVDPGLCHFHCVDFGLIDNFEIPNGAGE